MQVLTGKPIMEQIVAGRLCFYRRPTPSPQLYTQNNWRQEITRFHQAQQAAMEELGSFYITAREKVGEAVASIFNIHSLMLEDRDYVETVRRLIQGRGVTVTLTRENYPTKSYEGFTLPAGEYDSLRVILGEGQGHNWWCIVFPPVCLSAAQADTVEEQLGEEDFRLISEDGGYELRFRALELWGELVEKLG